MVYVAFDTGFFNFDVKIKVNHEWRDSIICSFEVIGFKFPKLDLDEIWAILG